MSTGKKIKTKVRIRLSGGAATPAPPVGTMLGQHQVNLMDFCKKFNAMTTDRKGQTVPVVVTVYTDKTFDILAKTAPVSELILKKTGIQKGSSTTGKTPVGKITWSQIEEIAKVKMPDLNAVDLDGAKKIIAGSARSMGIAVVD